MDHLVGSIAKLSQGRKNWYIGREGIPVDDSPGGKCEPVVVFECMDLSIGQRVNVSGLSCLVLFRACYCTQQVLSAMMQRGEGLRTQNQNVSEEVNGLIIRCRHRYIYNSSQ